MPTGGTGGAPESRRGGRAGKPGSRSKFPGSAKGAIRDVIGGRDAIADDLLRAGLGGRQHRPSLVPQDLASSTPRPHLAGPESQIRDATRADARRTGDRTAPKTAAPHTPGPRANGTPADPPSEIVSLSPTLPAVSGRPIDERRRTGRKGRHAADSPPVLKKPRRSAPVTAGVGRNQASAEAEDAVVLAGVAFNRDTRRMPVTRSGGRACVPETSPARAAIGGYELRPLTMSETRYPSTAGNGADPTFADRSRTDDHSPRHRRPATDASAGPPEAVDEEAADDAPSLRRETRAKASLLRRLLGRERNGDEQPPPAAERSINGQNGNGTRPGDSTSQPPPASQRTPQQRRAVTGSVRGGR